MEISRLWAQKLTVYFKMYKKYFLCKNPIKTAFELSAIVCTNHNTGEKYVNEIQNCRKTQTKKAFCRPFSFWKPSPFFVITVITFEIRKSLCSNGL